MIITVTERILRELNRHHRGIGGGKLYDKLTGQVDCEPTVFRTMLSQLVKRGYVYIDGKLQCRECCRESTCYRITEKGRYYLSERN